MGNFTQMFVFLLIVQMFYAFSITIFVPLIPEAQQNQIVMYTDEQGVISFSTIGTEITGAVGSQSTIPFADIGALIFYSTSLILNLVVNFFTAIPQMVTWLLVGLFEFIPITDSIQINVKMLFTAMITILYYFLLILFIMGARTQTQYS